MDIKKLIKSNFIWGIIISLIIGWFFYSLSQREREPVYSVKKDPSIIYSKNSLSPKLKIILNDSIKVTESVFVSSIVIWNNGEIEIDKKDVRKEFIISVSGDSKILDYKITKQTPLENDNFKVLPNGENLLIDWNYFDPEYGFEIQLIYSGNEKSRIEVNGSVLGNEMKEISNNPLGNILNNLVFIVLIIYYSMVTYYSVENIGDSPNRKEYLKIIGSIVIVIFFCIILITGFF